MLLSEDDFRKAINAPVSKQDSNPEQELANAKEMYRFMCEELGVVTREQYLKVVDNKNVNKFVNECNEDLMLVEYKLMNQALTMGYLKAMKLFNNNHSEETQLAGFTKFVLDEYRSLWILVTKLNGIGLKVSLSSIRFQSE